MKVCIVSNFYPPVILGGAEIIAKNIADGLGDKDVDVVAITSSNSLKVNKYNSGKVVVYSFFPLNLYWLYNAKKMNSVVKILWHLIDLWNPYVFFKVRNIMKIENVNIINTHNIDGFSFSIWSAAKSLGIPIVHTLHDHHMICPKNNFLKKNMNICRNPLLLCRIYLKISLIFSRYLDFVITPSNTLINRLKSYSVFTNTSVKVIYNGIESDDEERDEILHRIPIKTKKKLKNILFIGSIEDDKGVFSVIEIAENYKNWKFTIVGKGSREDRLKESIKKLDNIVYLGYMEGEKKDNEISNADMLLFPSLCLENLPTVIIEAFKYGLPVVASKTGGVTEMIVHKENGYMFSQGNIHEAIEYINELQTDEIKYEKMAVKSYKSFNKYKYSEQIDQYYDVIKSIIDL